MEPPKDLDRKSSKFETLKYYVGLETPLVPSTERRIMSIPQCKAPQ